MKSSENFYGVLDAFTREAGTLIQKGMEQNAPHVALRDLHEGWMRDIDADADPAIAAEPDLDPDLVRAYLRRWYRDGLPRDMLVGEGVDFLRERFGAIDRDGSMDNQQLKLNVSVRIASVAEAARMIMKGMRDDPTVPNVLKTETVGETKRWAHRRRAPDFEPTARQMIFDDGNNVQARFGLPQTARTGALQKHLEILFKDLSTTVLKISTYNTDQKTGVRAKGDCIASAIWRNAQPANITINGRVIPYSFKQLGLHAISMEGAGSSEYMPSTAVTALVNRFLAEADDPREGPADPPQPSKVPIVNLLSWMKEGQ